MPEQTLDYLAQLPEEILLKILSELSLENLLAMQMTCKRINQLKFEARTKKIYNQIWFNQFYRHFPHLLTARDRSEIKELDWASKTQAAYKQEYPIRLSRKVTKLFSMIKEDELNNLMQSTISFADLCQADASGFTPVDWARKKGHQDILKHFYKIIENFYLSPDKTNLMMSKRDSAGRSILDWAVICNIDISLLIERIKSQPVFNILTTALRVAARNGQVEMIKILIANNANINACGVLGKTPLMHAVIGNHKNVVDLLLQANANVNLNLTNCSSHDKKLGLALGDTPLEVAIKLGHIDIVQSLLAHHLNINDVAGSGYNALQLAAKFGQAEIVKLLLQHGADINARTSMGATALLFAVEYGHENVVNLLLANRADISIPLRSSGNHQDFGVEAGDTPLEAAIKLGRKEMVQSFLTYKADVNTIDSVRDALRLAAEYGQAEIVQLFLQLSINANINARNEMTATALLIAAKSGRAKIVELLLQPSVNVDINARSETGATALLIATEYGHQNVVDLLLANGADPSIPLEISGAYHSELGIEPGDTPFHAAIKLNRCDLLKTLFKSNTKISQEELLFCATKTGNLTAVMDLIKLGANIHATDKHGYTPLYYAVFYRHDAVADKLIESIHFANHNQPTLFNTKIQQKRALIIDQLAYQGKLLQKTPKRKSKLEKRKGKQSFLQSFIAVTTGVPNAHFDENDPVISDSKKHLEPMVKQFKALK